ncbi:MAG: hypothetical protein QOJ11_2610 [Frankiales bacterium]|nr:hypothetical protein [Frankiales bacterium]
MQAPRQRVLAVTTVLLLLTLAGCRHDAGGQQPAAGGSPSSQGQAGTGPNAPVLTPSQRAAPPNSTSGAIRAGEVSVGCRLRTLVDLAALRTGLLSTGTPAANSLEHVLAAPGRSAPLRLGALPRADWALIAGSPTYRVFGLVAHRQLTAVVQLKLYRGTWQVYAENCNLTHADGDAVTAESVAASGTTLDVNWDNGTCFPQGVHRHVPEQLGRRVIVTETPTHVLISVVAASNPQAVADEVGMTGCAGVGLADHIEAHLKAPIGQRTVLDVSAVPPRVLPTTGTFGQPLT